MTWAIASIQRDRAPWLKEWIAFHLVVGFDRFYLYLHRCTDDSVGLLQRLAKHYPIAIHTVDAPAAPQLAAYQHAWDTYGPHERWTAFIDGDEFLFPTRHESISKALASFESQPLSAVAAHWRCYGSSGHVADPVGLVLEQFTRHSAVDFLPNRHIKSIVRGDAGQVAITGSHLFRTSQGTVDDRMRPVEQPWLTQREPSYAELRINHYAVQSYDFFRRTKQGMGAADGNPSLVRPDAWFHEYDRNEEDDGIRYRFLVRLKLQLEEMDERCR